MSFIVLGYLAKIPTDIGDISMQIFEDNELTLADFETIRTNIRNYIHPSGGDQIPVDGSMVSYYREGSLAASCDSPIGLSTLSTFSGRELSIRANSNFRNDWRMYSGNSSIAQLFVYATAATYESRTAILFLIHVADGYLLGRLPGEGIYHSDPTVSHLGFATINNRSSQGEIVVLEPTGTLGSIINRYFLANPPTPTVTPDPYDPGGESGKDGGEGNFDDSTDNVDIPNPPTISSLQSSFISLYNPTLTKIKELADYVWADSIFDVDNFKRIVADPMDAILGLSIMPLTPTTSGEDYVYVGNLETPVSMPVITSQYKGLSCGSLTVSEYWGCYLDYGPYTQIDIYLPYIGIRHLDTDDLMGKTVTVEYVVDFLSGSCIALIKCGGSILYTFSGVCAVQVPLTSLSYNNVISGAITIAGLFAAGAAIGGIPAMIAGGLGAAAAAVNQVKPTTEHSGNIGGSAGFMAPQKPYLIIHRPKQALPAQQNYFIGYPSFITKLLGELAGYTEVETMHLENVPCTSEELAEIETLLKGGVLF